MLTRKSVKGVVEFNDGQFAEVQTAGIEGIEKDLMFEMIQLHREDTNDSPEEFRSRFPVDMWLNVLTITKVTPRRGRRGRVGAKRPVPKHE